MKRAFSPAMLMMLALVAGCATVRTTSAPEASLHPSQTFAFAPPRDPGVAQQPIGAIIQDGITRDLEAKGLTPAQPGTTPDLLVAWDVQYQQQLAVNWMYPYGGWWGWGWGWGWGGPWDVYPYTVGTITVSMVDPHTRLELWRGTATSVVNHPENPNGKKVAKAVDKMMHKYHPYVASAPAPSRM